MFRVGEKVVCVNNLFNNVTINHLKLNNIYTISEITFSTGDQFLIDILENETGMCYNSNRFISLQAHRIIKLKELIKCSE